MCASCTVTVGRFEAVGLTAAHGRDCEVGYKRDRGHGLATKAQCVQVVQVFIGRELAGGVALAQQREVLRLDARAIVLHLQRLEAAVLDDHGDAGCTWDIIQQMQDGERFVLDSQSHAHQRRYYSRLIP